MLECHLLLILQCLLTARSSALQWGPSVLVVVANLVMEYVEEKAFASFPHRVLFWKQYVGNSCCALPAQEITPFLHHLISMESSIQFTCEIEKDRFLDVLMHHNQNGFIFPPVSIIRPHMYTIHMYLDFSSHHPTAHKAAVVRTLQCRAMAISSSPDAANQEHVKYHWGITPIMQTSNVIYSTHSLSDLLESVHWTDWLSPSQGHKVREQSAVAEHVWVEKH